jgi:hypothetical protein
MGGSSRGPGWEDTEVLDASAARPVVRHVAGSVEELLPAAEQRHAMANPADGLSNARFERVLIDGVPHVLKHLHPDDDWVARATGDLACRPVVAWRSGLLDRLPPSIDHTVVACAAGLGRNGWGAAVLMRDVGPFLVPEAASLTFGEHRRFLAHMADLHATFWGWHDDVGLAPLGNRFLFLTPATAAAEAEHPAAEPIPPLVAAGWSGLTEVAPVAAAVVGRLLDDPSPLLEVLGAGPRTLIHGDWKAGNLGTHPDGRTILVDWAFPGEGPACADLGWYLAVNCDRLPEPKEAAIEAYRAELSSRGVSTEAWWDDQLEASLLGVFLQLGWSKSGTELTWWTDRVVRYAERLR